MRWRTSLIWRESSPKSCCSWEREERVFVEAVWLRWCFLAMSVARRVSSVCVRREKMWVWLAVGVWVVVEEEELELLDEEREEVSSVDWCCRGCWDGGGLLRAASWALKWAVIWARNLRLK